MDERRTRRTNWTKIRIVRFAASSTTGRREIFHRSTTCSLWRPGRGRGGKNLRWSFFSLSLSLPQSVLQREGMICLGRKRGRRFQDAFIHAAARSFFTIYFASARGKGFIARGGEEGDESGEEKEEQRIIYICVCVMSRQIFQSWLKLCFRDQVTFHSTDDSL